MGNLRPAGRMRPVINSCVARQTCRGKKIDEALPYCVGRYHRPFPFLTQFLHPITRFFTRVHIQRLFFFFKIGMYNFKFFACFARISKNFCQFLAKSGKFSLKFDPVYTRKVRSFLDPTTNDHFFYKILHQMPPVSILQLYTITFIFECLPHPKRK